MVLTESNAPMPTTVPTASPVETSVEQSDETKTDDFFMFDEALDDAGCFDGFAELACCVFSILC